MRPNPLFSDAAAARFHRNLVRRTLIPRCLAAIAAGGLLAGCADDVVLNNPRTGATQICRQSLGGLNPWSQTMACVGNYEAQGWTRTTQQ